MSLSCIAQCTSGLFSSMAGRAKWRKPKPGIPPKYMVTCGRCFKTATRADQNMGGAFLEFSMRTVMLGTSCVLSAISVCDNYQNFSLRNANYSVSSMG